MIDRRALEKAVADGVIDSQQAERIVAIAGELAAAPDASGVEPAAAPYAAVAEPGASRDPENLRFVRGFADIFVTIGIALVIGPAIYFSTLQFADMGAVAAVVALGAWGLAEYFTRIRLMALPSIVLLVVFTAACAIFFADLLLTIDSETLSHFRLFAAVPLAQDGSLRGFSLRGALAALLTAAAVALYYWRFRVPIAIAAGVAALVAVVLFAVMIAAPEFAAVHMRWLLFLAGIGVFLFAMRFDMSDPNRVTRRTDIAFWLHVLAAPLIVHPVLSSVVARNAVNISVLDATSVLALFVAIALVSVLIDRRSFLVAGLSYAGIAFRSLLGGAGAESAGAATLLILGAIILLLSAGWQYLRRLLMIIVPQPLALRLPPTKT